MFVERLQKPVVPTLEVLAKLAEPVPDHGPELAKRDIDQEVKDWLDTDKGVTDCPDVPVHIHYLLYKNGMVRLLPHPPIQNFLCFSGYFAYFDFRSLHL